MRESLRILEPSYQCQIIFKASKSFDALSSTPIFQSTFNIKKISNEKNY
jgi:hypothetical protein